jgi:hypothetical protein
MADAAKEQDKKRRVQLIALSIAGVFIVAAVVIFSNREKFVNYDHTLAMSAKAVNLMCPTMVDEDTRLDSVTTAPGRNYHYHYTAINLDRSTLNIDEACASMRETILGNMKGDISMADFGKNDVTMVFNFNDKNGDELCSIRVLPEEYYRKAKKTAADSSVVK